MSCDKETDKETTMKYFKDNQNQVFALEDADVLPIIETDDEGNETKKPSPWVKQDWVEITEQEATAIANPQPTEQELAQQRIAELKQLLLDSDYKVLPDYDKTDEAIIADRQAWRDEIRQLEATLNDD